ncbi:unnamed protein product [Mytilus coruscus]|uniref:C-type lectin domain-containing protein n=1 Tax=Mytilus coruscus TaxID=42192 RepID=A0A6J8D753_MYTCO|nr:unnamed protein product [Mytilus coruscus]
MCDYATEEINVIESVFPDSYVYLCDFHREQAWDRWLNAGHNGVQLYKSQILDLIRNIATASTEMEFEEAKDTLKESAHWRANKKIRHWFEKHWLSKSDRWVQAYRQNRFNVAINTNNGIERQNLALKYEYLQSRKASSLSHLLTIIVESFNFWTYRKYRKMNIQASDQARKYASDIPDFLTNRPPHIVKHCFVRWQETINIPSADIDVVDDINGTFLVKSQSILSGICLASNGTCGRKGFTCDETFGSGWIYNGSCCNERPCCKSPCVSETCPKGFKLLSNQTSSTNCYFDGGANFDDTKEWEEALSICSMTPGAYLWRPNTAQEANAVKNEIIRNSNRVWTGANDKDMDGIYTFSIENGPFSVSSLPFGTGSFSSNVNSVCVYIQSNFRGWQWRDLPCSVHQSRYICEYQRKVCP